MALPTKHSGPHLHRGIQSLSPHLVFRALRDKTTRYIVVMSVKMPGGKGDKTTSSWGRLKSKVRQIFRRQLRRPGSTVSQTSTKESGRPSDERLEPQVASSEHGVNTPTDLPSDDPRDLRLASSQHQIIAPDGTFTSEPPSSPEPSNLTGSSGQNDLWNAARSGFKEKDEDLDRALQDFIEEKHDSISASDLIQGASNGDKIIRDLKSELDDEKARKDAGAWKVTIGTRTIVIREVVDRIAKGLEKFKDLIDHAVSYGPVEAKLPWAVFKFLLQVVGLDKEQKGLILVGMDTIMHAYLRSSIYQELYLSIPGRQTTTDELKTSIIDLYTTFFEFMGLIAKYQSSGWWTNTARALTCRAPAECLEKITKTEKKVKAYAVTCERVLASEARELHREWFDKLMDFQKDLDQKVNRIEAGVSQLVTDLDNRKVEEILKWISPVPYETDLQNAKKGRLPGTCEWLITHETYIQWKESAESRTLWLHGIVGAGKTTLSSKVVDDVISDGMPCAYFFCDRNRKDRQDPLGVLLSILRQLTRTSDQKQLRTCIVEAYKSKKKQGFASERFSIDECLDLLSELLDGNPQSTILVDGLDECDKGTRIDILDAFDRLTRDRPNILKVFVASREDQDLIDHYQSSPNVSIKATDNLDDIETFVTQSISKHTWASKNISAEVTQEVVRCFREKSEGMFQWAVLHINDLLKWRSNDGILDKLGQLPTGLRATYDEIYDQLDEELKTVAIQAFRWLMVSPYPINPELMCILVSQEPDKDFILRPTITRDALLDACRNLIKIDKDRNDEVCRFSHLSVQEYLQKHHPELDANEEMHLKVSLKFWKLVTTRDTDAMTPFGWDIRHLRFVSLPVECLLRGRGSISEEMQQESWDILCSTSRADGLRGDLDVVRGGPVWKAFTSNHSKERRRQFEWYGPIYVCASNCNVASIESWIKHGMFSPSTNNKAAAGVIRHAWGELGGRSSSTLQSKGCVAITNLLLDNGTSYKDESTESLTQLLLDYCQVYYAFQQRFWELRQFEYTRGHISEKRRERRAEEKRLHYASSADLITSLIRLLEQIRKDGASVEKTDLTSFKYDFFDGTLPLEVIQWFLDNGLNVNASIKTATNLTSAVKRRSRYTSNLEIVELLLERGAEVNKPDGASETALLIAAYQPEDVDTVRLLLKYGADPNQGNERVSPLQVAALYAKAEIVKLLLDSKAQIQAVGLKYGTALHAAALRGSKRKEIYDLLLSYGADPSVQCTLVDDVFTWSLLEGQKYTAEQILKARLDEE